MNIAKPVIWGDGLYTPFDCPFYKHPERCTLGITIFDGEARYGKCDAIQYFDCIGCNKVKVINESCFEQNKDESKTASETTE